MARKKCDGSELKRTRRIARKAEKRRQDTEAGLGPANVWVPLDCRPLMYLIQHELRKRVEDGRIPRRDGVLMTGVAQIDRNKLTNVVNQLVDYIQGIRRQTPAPPPVAPPHTPPPNTAGMVSKGGVSPDMPASPIVSSASPMPADNRQAPHPVPGIGAPSVAAPLVPGVRGLDGWPPSVVSTVSEVLAVFPGGFFDFGTERVITPEKRVFTFGSIAAGSPARELFEETRRGLAGGKSEDQKRFLVEQMRKFAQLS